MSKGANGDFAKAFKAWRARRKLSQSGASKALGISTRTIQSWEHGEREPQGFARHELEKIIAK